MNPGVHVSANIEIMCKIYMYIHTDMRTQTCMSEWIYVYIVALFIL